MSQMHEFTKENRKKVQGMFVSADPHGSMMLTAVGLFVWMN